MAKERSQLINAEEIRGHYRPNGISVLFVGESPPDSGKFFYYENSPMFNHMRRILGQQLFRSTEDFLQKFKASGCYLDDLVPKPGKPSPECRRQAIPELAERIREYRPRVVVALLKRIGDDVRTSVEQSGVEASVHETHFPGNGQQGRFEQDIKTILPALKRALVEYER